MVLSYTLAKKANKIVVVVFLFLLVQVSSLQFTPHTMGEFEETNEEPETNPYRILFVMDDDYGGNCEFIIGIFRDFGWNITIAATKKSITGCSYLGFASFEVNCCLSSIESFYSFDCVSILPGASHANLLNNNKFHAKVQAAVANNVLISAWCRAVRILAKADVISGRNVTGHIDYWSEYVNAGATFKSDSPPILDGNIITSVRSRFYRQETCDLIKSAAENRRASKIFEFSTYVGSPGDDIGVAAAILRNGDVTVDSQGNIILAARTAGNFPVLNAFQNTSAGNIDITISKFSPNGTLLFSTYFGGSENEWPMAIEVDQEDNIVFAGITGSANFPLKDPYQDTLLGGIEGDYDCYAAKLSADGQTLLYSTFFGGTGSDWCYEMNVDADGRIALTGTTQSTNLPTKNAYQTGISGGLDSYVVLFAPDGQSLEFMTYLGSGINDHGRGIDFDSNGDLFLTGYLGDSNHGTEGAFQTEFNAASDGYVAKFARNGTLKCFSYLGGSGTDRPFDLVVNNNDDVIISGFTSSLDLPLENAYKSVREGTEIFVSSFTNDLSSLQFSTYFGGTGNDYANDVDVDENDNVYVTGYTDSEDYPITNNAEVNTNYSNDNAILFKLNAAGSKLLFSSKIGGNQDDVAVGVTVDSNSTVIIAGLTESPNFPVYRAFQDEYGGNWDWFISKIIAEDFIATSSGNSTTSGFIGTTCSILLLTSLTVITRKYQRKKRKT